MTQLRNVLALTVAALLIPAAAAAEEIGALQVLLGNRIDANMRQGVQRALQRGGNAGSHRLIPEAETRQKIPQAARDCFTPSCLKQAGTATGADGGIRVRFNGEAEIYDWNVDIYDLRNGASVASESGSCELCGVAEVERDFEASVRATLAKAKFSKPATKVATNNTPPKTTKPAPPEPTDAELPPIEPATGSGDTSDPMAGLVMVEISATPDDAIITMGDQQIGVGSAAISVEPGTYEIAFSREGYGGLRESITISPNSADKAFLRVHLSKTDPDAVYVDQDGPMDRLGDKKMTYGLIGLGSGAVLLATGAWLNAIDGRPTCGGSITACERVRETSAAAFITTMAGGVLATGGAVFLVWDVLSGRTEPQQTARIVPLVGSDSAGVGFIGRF